MKRKENKPKSAKSATARLDEKVTNGSAGEGAEPKRPRVRIPPPIKPVNTSFPSSALSRSEKTVGVPPDPPHNFPDGFWAEACVILRDAVQKYPDLLQQRELCRHAVSELTPLFCRAIQNGQIEADAVLKTGLGGMPDLLRGLLIHNGGGNSWGALSNEAYRILEDSRKSSEWADLEKAVVNTHKQSPTTVSIDVQEQRPSKQVQKASEISGSRNGIRNEVRAWMAKKGLTTNAQAANRLRLSVSALKSMMSSRGKTRYGAKNFERVRSEISADLKVNE